MAKKETAVAVKSAPAPVAVVEEPKALATTESYIENSQDGLEELDNSDFTMPRLALCQSNTPQRKKSDPNFIEGLDEGDFFNTVSGKNYGPELLMLPIKILKQRIKFFPIDDGGGIDCRSFNGRTGGHYSPENCEACQYSKFSQDSEGESQSPECQLFHTRVSYVVEKTKDGYQIDPSDVAAFSLKSTGLAISKQWAMKTKLMGKAVYAHIWSIKSVEITKGGNKFYSIVMPKVEATTPKEMFEIAKEQYGTLAGRNIVVDTTGEGDEGGGMGAEGFNTTEM